MNKSEQTEPQSPQSEPMGGPRGGPNGGPHGGLNGGPHGGIEKRGTLGPDLVGCVLQGAFQIEALIATDPSGWTYTGTHIKSGKPALLRLARKMPGPDRSARVRADLQMLSELSHPGFLQTEVGEGPEGTLYIASERLQGETLADRLLRGPLTPTEAGLLIAKAARSLEIAHRYGVAHGGLRPEHIFVPSAPGKTAIPGEPVLLYPALYYLRTMAPAQDPAVPLSFLGYLSPEHATGGPPDRAGDVFSLGTILYECLSGRQAFTSDTRESLLERLQRPPPPLSGVAAPPQLVLALNVIVAGACASQRQGRIPTMSQFASALVQCYLGAGMPLPGLSVAGPSGSIAQVVTGGTGQFQLIRGGTGSHPRQSGIHPVQSGVYLSAPQPSPQNTQHPSAAHLLQTPPSGIHGIGPVVTIDPRAQADTGLSLRQLVALVCATAILAGVIGALLVVVWQRRGAASTTQPKSSAPAPQKATPLLPAPSPPITSPSLPTPSPVLEKEAEDLNATPPPWMVQERRRSSDVDLPPLRTATEVPIFKQRPRPKPPLQDQQPFPIPQVDGELRVPAW